MKNIHTIKLTVIKRQIVIILFLLSIIFTSCAGYPGAENKYSTIDNEPLDNRILGILNVKLVNSWKLSPDNVSANVLFFPDLDLFALEIPIENNLSYRQIWDKKFMESMEEAISLFSVDNGNKKSGSGDTRNIKAYGTLQGLIQWHNSTYKRNISSETKIDLGYLSRGEKGYFMVTQRESPIKGDLQGRIKLKGVDYCISGDEINVLKRIISNGQLDEAIEIFKDNNYTGYYDVPENETDDIDVNSDTITNDESDKSIAEPNDIKQNQEEVNDTIYMVFLGDNVTAGTGATVPDTDDRENAFPALIQRMLNITVINSGINWNTTAIALENLDDTVLKYSPEIVVINLGLVDFIMKVSPAVIKENLQKIINVIQNSGAKIFLTRFYDEYILRSFMNFWEMNIYEQNYLIQEYNKIFNDLAENNNVELIINIWTGLDYNDTIAGDHINPNVKGHYLMAENFLNALKPYLESKNFLK